MNFQTWMRVVWDSLMTPAEVAGQVARLRYEPATLWAGLALVAVLNALVLGAVQLILPAPEALEGQMLTLSPFANLLVVAGFLVVLVLMLVWIGRAMGGVGTVPVALTMVIWFQLLTLTLEAIQLVLLFLSPVVSGLFGLLTLGGLVWVFINLVNVLHGFGNLWKAVGLVFVALIGTLLGTGLFMAIMGLTPAGVTT